MPAKINGSKNAKKQNFKILIFFVFFAIALFSFLSGFVVFASENAKDGGEKPSESCGVFSEKNESSDFLENFENQKSDVGNFLSVENPCSAENLPLYFGNPSCATSESDNAKPKQSKKLSYGKNSVFAFVQCLKIDSKLGFVASFKKRHGRCCAGKRFSCGLKPSFRFLCCKKI